MKAGKNQQVILRFIDAVSDNDKERVLSFISEETVIQTSPNHKAVGRAAIWDFISSVYCDAEAIDWRVDHLAEDDNGKVQTRGALRYCVNGQWNELPVNGEFELKGSKIVQWR